MPISWNEIKSRAINFMNEWKEESKERAEKDSFWNSFFDVFGITRRRIATFEKSVKRLGGKHGYIDLFWKGHILVEHKSRGKDLEEAYEQAKSYFPGLKEEELPKYILISDFENFHLYDLETDKVHKFIISEFLDNIHLFGFIAGYEKREYKDEDPVNIQAAELMGKLHDRLEEVGYTGHDLEVYLVRLLFCLFAEDTNIFEKGLFYEYIDNNTKDDGTDLAPHLDMLFHVLNTPTNKRLKNLDEALQQFPYVNGQLFAERLQPAAFDSKMREMLLEACGLDWGKISPAIFGSMFQAVMNPKERRNLGAHYTSEKNILKLIKPLFLDDLQEEFEKHKNDKNELGKLQKKLATLKFLDPACGCGNFLIITYRELRRLELEILKQLYGGQQVFDIGQIVTIDIDQFYGIEYDEFAVRVGEVAMWLIDHQMNMEVSKAFGAYFARLPLQKSVNITHGNALQTDWKSLIAPTELSYIIGNPPFYGSKLQSKEQREDLANVFGEKTKNAKIMDYVSAWYIRAAQYIQDTEIKVAFVSTNSITQGEQVSVLWGQMLNKYNVKIHFAHRTFKWSNEAKGNAGVYCVIISFGSIDTRNKKVFEYEDVKGEPTEIKVKNINPYLVDALDLVVTKRTKPISNVPKMSFGNMPLDGGNLLLSDTEKVNLLSQKPHLEKYIKPLVSAREFLNGGKRWCFWLVGVPPNEIRSHKELLDRVQAVKQFRLSSKAPSTQKHAETPTLFRDRNNPESFIVVPRVSSENRKYIPMGFFDKNFIVSDTCMSISNGDIFLFGVLSSEMHMTWVRYTCGRLESRFRYSKNIVYNNYPFPKEPSDKNKEKVEKAAQKVLDIRAKYLNNSLADLYDPLATPPDLVKAHRALDKAVDLCYRPQPFTNERNRIEFLFNLYEEYTKPLLTPIKKKKK